MSEEAQYLKVARILAERIDYGDYQLTRVPSGRQLAEELNVSHIVVRKAIEKLISEGRCRRLGNGRLSAIPGGKQQTSVHSIALLHPAFDSYYLMRCRQMLEREAAGRNCLFRAVSYMHWNDPAIQEALNGFDGLFLISTAELLDESTREKFRIHRKQIITIDLDLTDLGIPRIALFDSSCVRIVLDHLIATGHRSIDCLNTQPCDVEIQRRIAVWRQWRDQRRFTGTLHNHPVEPYTDSALGARDAIGHLLDSGKWRLPDAIFCTNEAAAYGVLRALRDHGLEGGREISVAAVGDGGQARYFCPSITCVEMSDASRCFAAAFDRLLGIDNGGNDDAIHPGSATPTLFPGESTRRQVAEVDRTFQMVLQEKRR